MGPPSDKHEKGGTDCTHSSNSKSHDWNGDPQSTPYTQTHHASESPSAPEPPPPESLLSQSSHASEEASSSEASTSFVQPHSCSEGNTAALWLSSCNCSQRESQDDFLEMDLREGWEGEHLSPSADEECQEHGIFELFI